MHACMPPWLESPLILPPPFPSLPLLATAAASARRAAEEAGRDGRRAAKASSYTGMSLHEARQILNVRDVSDTEAVKKVKRHCTTWSKSFLLHEGGKEGGRMKAKKCYIYIYMSPVFYCTEL